VSRELILACRDRLNFWHALQEMAGVRNPYVERATDETRIEERGRAAEERGRLQAEHAAELERVREAAAGEAMQRLTDMLLGLDLAGASVPLVAEPSSADSGATQSGAPTVAEPLPPEESEADAEAVAPEADSGFDEPWIDTPLCTSCNDCTNLNPQLFLYNEDKQALLGDLDKGTYAQLVEAAELCPAGCIHPGKPWNPQELGLEELIERAAPFNQ